MRTMGNVSRPLIALLVATVAFFALWLVALKGGGSGANNSAPTITGSGAHAAVSSGGSSGGSLGSYQSDINAAKNVQNEVNGNTASQSAAEAGSSAAPAASSATAHTANSASSATPASSASSTAASKTHSASTAKHRAAATAVHAKATHHARVVVQPNGPATPTARLDTVARALAADDVVALLFYNPDGPDDNAVRQELMTIPTHGGQVVKVAVPLTELPSYATLTSQFPVNFSPTLVVIDRHHQAYAITGFADTLEIAGRIADAL